MSWAIGFIERLDTEYQVIRYRSLEAAGVSLAELMAMKGPYSIRELMLVTRFLVQLEEMDESTFDTQLFFCETSNVMFMIGRFDTFANDPENEAPYRVVQDHRDCTPDFCFGDIAERN